MSHSILCGWFVLYALFKLWTVIATCLNVTVSFLRSGWSRRGEATSAFAVPVVLGADVKISSASFLFPLHLPPTPHQPTQLRLLPLFLLPLAGPYLVCSVM